MVSSKDSYILNSPTRITNEDAKNSINKKNGEGSMKMKREVGWLTGASLIISSMIGSGIFISPQHVLKQSGSVFNSLIIWLSCGILSSFGAVSYAEVGTMIPKSGGEFPIILEAFGGFPAFLFAWTSCVVLKPSAFAILSLTFSKYALSPFFEDSCEPPQLLLKLTAGCVIMLIVFVNCTSVKLSTGFLNVFSVGKIISLIIIIIGGFVMLLKGRTKSFENIYDLHDDKQPGPKEIVLAFYQGLWSFDGWNQLNYVVEELKSPSKNLPRAVGLAMTVVTLLYIFTNISYLAVMSPFTLINSPAVGFTFGERVLGVFKWIIPAFVSWSVLGACLGSCFAAGRISFVAARENQFPQILSMLNVNYLTPAPAVLLNGLLAILMVIPNDFNSLVNYFSFSMWVFHFGTCAALLYFRWERPNVKRPIKVPIFIPIVVCLCAILLILTPLVDKPEIQYLYATIFIFSGSLFYLPFVYFGYKLDCFDSLYKFIQKLMYVVPSNEY